MIVEVRPRLSGHIQEVCFQSGQLVEQGDVLSVIDPRWHEAEGRHANFQEAQAAVPAAKAARDTARLDLDHTRIRAPGRGRASLERVTAGHYNALVRASNLERTNEGRIPVELRLAAVQLIKALGGGSSDSAFQVSIVLQSP